MSQPSDVASSLQNLAAILLSSITNPADGIRIFAQLNNFSVSYFFNNSTFSQSEQTVQIATADLCRRIAVIALAQAAEQYQPTSQNDAQNIQEAVCNLIDNEILIAGDQGLDETFYALKNLRNAVWQDLTAKGSILAFLQTFTTNLPQPALVLAYQYYQDINRTDQLINSANPRHPAFMPTSFQALSS
jgi:prophage DNA circulation protein